MKKVGNEVYDVFVSYSRADWRHAVEIDSALRARGLKPFFDRRNLQPGLRWVPALEQAISASKAVLVKIPVDKWHELIGDPTYADAILDRIVHNAHRINLAGHSLRRSRANKTPAHLGSCPDHG
jgi:hypothetical protein